MANRNIYSVAQVNSYIKNMFAQDFMLRQVSIKGEVSNCKYHTSGHIYFTIKDAGAAMNAIMFAGSRAAGLSFHMKEGDQVIVTGSVEVYEKTGAYQLYAKKIELDGEGNLYLKFEQLKHELEEMGMFAAEYKQPIPRYAGRIGVVTAPTGAAVQDIRNVSSRRNPYVQVILYPTLVQGEGAANSIVKGIQTLDAMNLDVIIVGRGGGSIEDLWAFNEEIVARAVYECSVPVISAVGHETDTTRAIFDCRTPIISAVGHETDWTIADFVSDRRAPTPSAAAELAVSDYRQTLERLDNLRRRMDRNLTGRIDFFREKLSHIKTRLNFLSPQNKLNENKRRLADIEDALERIMKQRLSDCRQRLALLSGTLDAYSPAKKLAQGYAYVEVEKKGALHSVSDINAGDDINIYLIDGHARAVVSEVINDEQRK